MITKTNFKLSIIIIALNCLLACKSDVADKTKIVIYTSAPLNSKLIIKTIPFVDEKEKVVDSAVIKNNHDSLVLYLPHNEERLFKIIVSDTRLEMIIINDSKLIRIHANYFSKIYTVQGSKATASLKEFGDKRINTVIKLNNLKKQIDSLNKYKNNKKVKDSLNEVLRVSTKKFKNNDITYADTVSSPAAFLEVNNLIDFEDDIKSFKKFITRASTRFPNYSPLKKLKADAFATAKILEEEYLIGDKLPPITLRNEFGINFSTSSLEGKYYLIDFWSTWCQSCLLFSNAENKLLKDGTNNNLFIVSVALDNQYDEWKKFIPKNKLNWIQLIDQEMWQGTAARTLKFDSIPFNFLVSPKGKIIAKAIKPDSLKKVIQNLAFH